MRNVLLLLSFAISINSFAQLYKYTEQYYQPHKKWGKWGYVYRSGKAKIHYQFEEAFPFTKELALVKKKGKYGFIDINGRIVINCDYDNAQSFQDSFAWVKKNGSEALMKKDGSVFLNYWFVKIEQFKDGYAKVVFKNDSLSNILKEHYVVAYLNKDGHQLSDKWFSGGGSFKNGFAKVSISDEYFYLDTLGRIVGRSSENCDEAIPYNPNSEIQEMPKFPSGELGFLKFVEKHVKYPKKARTEGIEGKVYVQFLINKEGEVTNASVFRGVHNLLNQEAIRVISILPDWLPGKMNGKPVCVWLTLPIAFQLL